jgi:hypothetical protein
MRATAITLAILGPLLTFFLGGLVTALTLLGSPSTITSPRGYLVTVLGAAPGVALSLVAVVVTQRSAGQYRRLAWRALLVLWALAIIAAATYVAVAHNSADFPWFFPLIALPLASLIYAIFNRA